MRLLFRCAYTQLCIAVCIANIRVITGVHGAQVTNFGNPFLMRVGERETLAQLRPRIQVLLPWPPCRLPSGRMRSASTCSQS